MDKILLETCFHWLSDDIVRFVIEVGVYDKYAKNVTVVTRKKSRLTARCSGRCHGDDQRCQLIFSAHCQT